MLENRKIVVTGANGGLGRIVCEFAEAQGACTVRLDLVFSEPADNCHAVDLTDPEATAAVLAAAGDYDAVFNIAGGFAMGTDTWEASDDDWERMFALNVTTLRTVLKTAVPHLLQRGGGNIVNVGAYGALQGQGAMSAYCASKSVVMRLTESLAEEVRERGVNVNAVLPTVIDTPANRQAMPDVDPAQWVAPADLAKVICFLGSSAARAVHGALVPVRGLS
ncbi:MAG: NAD(P)-dependent dehydrogenase (short-subunit alcohol dehydrogenase family) [Bacteroidia bacterium]|jgi:NAD(P)-dependent dehydrogenase (short-subunit alcohol dehydrogenase family)